MNWSEPLLWDQIENAARKTGRPWSPRLIMKELHRDNYASFQRLTEQVIGRWIDPEAKAHGESKWKDSVLAHVEHGNSPGRKSTQTGILVGQIFTISVPELNWLR
jgi:hypothetical protein